MEVQPIATRLNVVQNDVLTLSRALLLELPLTGLEWGFDTANEQKVYDVVWKGYDAASRLLASTIDTFYCSPLFWPAAINGLQSPLYWQPPNTTFLRTFFLQPAPVSANPAPLLLSGALPNASEPPPNWPDFSDCFEPVEDAPPNEPERASHPLDAGENPGEDGRLPDFSACFEPVADGTDHSGQLDLQNGGVAPSPSRVRLRLSIPLASCWSGPLREDELINLEETA